MIPATRETASQPGFPQDRWGVASEMRTRPPLQKGLVVLGARTLPILSPFRSWFLLPGPGDPTTKFPLYNSKAGAHTGAVRTQLENLLPRPRPPMPPGLLQGSAGLSGRNVRLGVWGIW